jgi:2-oxoisovalerate dehydrogenase E1 component
MAKYSLDRLSQFPELTPEVLRLVYSEMCVARFHVERVVQECSKGNIKFAIWGPGEELHGAAQALAYKQIANLDAFGIVGHYRSAGLLGTWSKLNGYDDFHLDHMRQQLSRVTDPWSGGRQMTAHFNDLRNHILPVQSALGMQFGKAVGYAHGMRMKGHDDGLVVCVVGDGTTAESDFHEGMNGAAVLKVPVLIEVTDNGVAISVKPEDGRGIVDFEAYAKAFGFEFFTCDGNDFLDVYETSLKAGRHCQQNQAPALMWVRNLARLNGHSNAGVYNYVFEAHDCLNDFGEALVEAGILTPEEIVRRNGIEEGKDYYRRHELGTVAKAADDYVLETMRIAGDEPEPEPESIWAHIRDPYPVAVEPPTTGRPTVISLNGAIRAALRDILEEKPLSWIYGQDVAERGGVMQATMGLWQRFPERVRDAPINEPLIVGAAVGFALHDGALAMPEIQFSDYSLNTLHWLVYMGNLLWTSNGTARANVILRLPTEPLHGGAIYHSMCMEGFYGAIPGLTILAPTTSRDFYGLLRSAAEYSGPVLVFESKGLYRLPLGDAFPGEPTDPKEVADLKRAIGFQGLIPDLPRDFRVPLGKAAVRRTGKDLTIATWGRCTMFVAEAVESLAQRGVDVEVLDMRTIVPPEMDAVLSSVRKTGRLLVVHEDRVFSSVGREIQGAVIEAMPGEHVVTRVLGQEPVPGIPQNIHLEHRIAVSPEKIVDAAMQVMAIKWHEAAASAVPRQVTTPSPAAAAPTRTRVLWTPNRHFVS